MRRRVVPIRHCDVGEVVDRKRSEQRRDVYDESERDRQAERDSLAAGSPTRSERTDSSSAIEDHVQLKSASGRQAAYRSRSRRDGFSIAR